MVLVPLKKTLTLYFALGVSVLFTKVFGVWYDNSSSFYKLSCGWVWLSVSLLLGIALLNEQCLIVFVL